MPTIRHKLRNYLKYLAAPWLIPDRLAEKRMQTNAQLYYQTISDKEIAAERAVLFSHLSAADIATLEAEARRLPVYQQIEAAKHSENPDLKIAASQTTSLVDCISMYIAVRAWQPRVMVETGVFYGGGTAMILHAMQHNGGGQLYSIDLPIETDGLSPELRGGLVPEELRANWRLTLGDSLVELPKLLGELGEIEAFHHDSLHSTRHMTWEYKTAWPYIKPGGFLSSHDVRLTPSWGRFSKQYQREIDAVGRVYGMGFAHKRV